MNPAGIDRETLHGAAAVFCASLAISCLALAAGWQFERAALRELEEEKELFHHHSHNYLQVEAEESAAGGAFHELIELQRKGVVGAERRIDWVEALRASVGRLRLPAYRYAINPQEIHAPDDFVVAGRFRVYASTMHLGLDLLHEGDFLGVLNDLHVFAPDAFSVAGCRLARLARPVRWLPDQANINAECDLKWFNIRLADGSEIEL